MAAKKKPASLGNKVKKILKNTAKQTGKDLLMLGTIVGPGKAVKGAQMVAKASRTTGIAGFGAARTPAQNFGKYAQIDDVKSKTARKIGDKISGASSKKVQKKLNEYAKSDSKNYNIDPQFATHPGSISLKGNKRVIDPKGKFPTARQSVRWRKAEDKAGAKANARGLKAAQGKSLASPVKKAAAKKNAKERAMVKRIAQANKSLNMKEPYATKDAMRLADRIKASKKK